jgi:hypothetical protein
MLRLTFVEGEPPPHASIGREVNSWCDERGEVCARGFAGPSLRWIDCPGLAVFAFEARSSVVRAWPAPGSSRKRVTDRFTRILQPAILQAMGWQALHASAVAGKAGALALCGVSESGKSTLAYALGRAGFTQFADDGLVIRVTGAAVFAHPLPFAPRLRGDAVRSLGTPSPEAICGGAFGDFRPVKAIVLLQQDPRTDRPRLDRLRPAEAFSALVPHAHCFDPASPVDGRQFVEDYLTVAAGIPVYALTYRGGIARLSGVIDVVHALALESEVIPARQPELVPALP